MAEEEGVEDVVVGGMVNVADVGVDVVDVGEEEVVGEVDMKAEWAENFE